jgi:hypothetical protein
VNVGGEESKSGMRPEEVEETLREIAKFSRVHVKGLMAIPPICEEPEENRKYFQRMRNLFLDIGSEKIDNSSMEILSMGMSDDYEVAIEEGATLVRVGTALFGYGVMSHHGVDVSAVHQKSQPGLAEPLEILGGAIVGLGDDGHGKALRLQHAGNDRRAKGRVVNVGVSRYHNKIRSAVQFLRGDW